MKRPWTSLSDVPSRPIIVVLVVILIAVGSMLWMTIRAQNDAQTQVRKTTAVLSALRRTLRSGINAETGQRGYLITGDPSYLVPYDRGRLELLSNIETIRETIGDTISPRQDQLIAQLTNNATTKLAEMDRTVQLYRSGERDKAIEIVRSDIGQNRMRKIREEIGELETAEEEILEAALQRAAVVQARMLPISAFLALTVLMAVMLLFWLGKRTTIAEEAAKNADALRRARQRSDLLARELNHRVKNLFAVVLAIVGLSGRNETDVKEAIRKIRERIHALSLAHAVSQGQLDTMAAGLHEVLEATLAPYLEKDGASERLKLDGPTVELPAKALTPIGLMIHELATNAVKYGALSKPDGLVTVSWDTDLTPATTNVRLTWRETGVGKITEPETSGFGSVMMQQSATQLGGKVERSWEADGLVALVTFKITHPEPVDNDDA